MVSKFSFNILGFLEMQLNIRTFAPLVFSIEWALCERMIIMHLVISV